MNTVIPLSLLSSLFSEDVSIETSVGTQFYISVFTRAWTHTTCMHAHIDSTTKIKKKCS
jgi:hypothetical protein